jgi:hypothetical protein
LEDLGLDGRINVGKNLTEMQWERCELDLSVSGGGSVVGTCEPSNEPLYSMKVGEYLV